MPVTRVENSNELLLGGNKYRLKTRLIRQLASEFPRKMVLGDYSEESNPVASTFTLSDLRLGVGKEVVESTRDIFQAWSAPNMDLRRRGHIIPARAMNTNAIDTTMTVFGTAQWPNSSTQAIDTYVATHAGSALAVHYTTPGHAAFAVSSVQSSAQFGTGSLFEDFKTLTVGGTRYLAACDGVKMWHTSAPGTSSGGSSWTTSNIAFSRMAAWRDMFWGVTSSGGTYFNPNLGDTAGFVQIAKLPDDFNAISAGLGATQSRMDLFTGPDGTGGDALYCATRSGLLIYDNAAEQWRFTGLRFISFATYVRATVWRQSIYVATGLTVWKYTPGPAPVIESVGLDELDSLPDEFAYQARNNTGAPAYIRSITSTPAGIFVSTNGIRDALWAYTEATGWNSLYAPASTTDFAFDNMEAHSFSDSNRDNVHLGLFAAGDSRLLWMPVATTFSPTDVKSSIALAFGSYNSSARLESPWLKKAGSQAFTAHQVIVNSTHPSTGTNLTIQYALNNSAENSSDFTTIATKSVSGEEKYLLPNSTEPKGIDFDAFRFGIDFTSSVGYAPDLHSISLVFSKNLQPVYQFLASIDLSRDWYGRTPKEMREELNGMIARENGPLYPVTFRDENNVENTHYVKVLSPQFSEESGNIESGEVNIALVEPVPAGG